MENLSNQELDALLKRIDDGDLPQSPYMHLRLLSEADVDIISVINNECTVRRIYQRKAEKEWVEVTHQFTALDAGPTVVSGE